MADTEPADGDSTTLEMYYVTLKPKHQWQHDRVKWIESDSVAVRDGLVLFGGPEDPDRILDADEVLDVEPVEVG
jgi:hypothetical protein